MRNKIFLISLLLSLFICAFTASAVSTTLHNPVNYLEETLTSINFSWTPVTTDYRTTSYLYSSINDGAWTKQATVECYNNTACSTTDTGLAVGFHEWRITTLDDQTNATVTGLIEAPFNTSINYVMNLTYTVNAVEEKCTALFNRSEHLDIIQVKANVVSYCNMSATNVSGYLILTTYGQGDDEYIIFDDGGNATDVLGFTANTSIITYGTDTNGTSESRWLEIRTQTNATRMTWGNETDTIMWLDMNGNLSITGSLSSPGGIANALLLDQNNTATGSNVMGKTTLYATGAIAAYMDGDILVKGNLTIEDTNQLNASGDIFCDTQTSTCNFYGFSQANVTDLYVSDSVLHVDGSSGNVGIGTTNPVVKLAVNGGTDQIIGMFNSTDAGSVIQIIDTGAAIANIGVSDGVAKFGARSIISNSDLVVTTTGNVGIGTIDPSSLLHVFGDTNITNGNLTIANLTGANNDYLCIDPSGIVYRSDGVCG